METLYQVALQIVLLFFTQTNTPTTGGLESFFAKKTFLGLEIDPTWILVIFVGLSLKSCIFQHIKAVSAEKGFFGLKAKLAVFAWAVFATIRKAYQRIRRYCQKRSHKKRMTEFNRKMTLRQTYAIPDAAD